MTQGGRHAVASATIYYSDGNKETTAEQEFRIIDIANNGVLRAIAGSRRHILRRFAYPTENNATENNEFLPALVGLRVTE
ncbi:hypothetical protein [Bordetella parapertussis]|uniref:hypothetical protein n=1 Tax=Bordetella parapertussis TaxID=519 RepID=UPI0013E8E641|nr:hypothetical protein [Bordetella parapertussis]